MDRRAFIAGVTASLAAPLAVEAQGAKIGRLGFLTPGSTESASGAVFADLQQGLREPLGLIIPPSVLLRTDEVIE